MSALADSTCAVPLTITLHPSATVWSSGLESYPAAHHSAEQLGALGSSEQHRRWVTKLTGKISGCPPRIVTSRPNDTLDSKLQLSSSLSTVTGSPADMIQPNAMGISSRSDVMADECRPSHRIGTSCPRPRCGRSAA